MQPRFNIATGEYSILIATPTPTMITWLQDRAASRGVSVGRIYSTADDGVYLIPEIGSFNAGAFAEFLRQLKPAIFLTELARFGKDVVDHLPEPPSEQLMDRFIRLELRDTATHVGTDAEWRRCTWSTLPFK